MDNVAVYLNQDSARKLLKSSSPTDFYRFFEDALDVEVRKRLLGRSVAILLWVNAMRI